MCQTQYIDLIATAILLEHLFNSAEKIRFLSTKTSRYLAFSFAGIVSLCK